MKHLKPLVLLMMFLAIMIHGCAPGAEPQPQPIAEMEEPQPHASPLGNEEEPQPQAHVPPSGNQEEPRPLPLDGAEAPQPIPLDSATETDQPIGSDPVQAPETGNKVTVHFSEEFIHEVSGDTFVNGPVTGKRRWRALQPINDPDETGASVSDLKLILNCDLASVDGLSQDRLTKTDPPVYEWTLGDLVEGPPKGWHWDAFVDSDASPTMFTPGVDVSRSFDRTEFPATGIQRLTITLNPREGRISKLAVFVHTDEDEMVDPIILSVSASNEGSVELGPDGRRSGVHYVSLEVGVPITLEYTIQVTPKGIPVAYKPYTAVDLWMDTESSSGTTKGSFVSQTSEVGTWTFSAEGEYVWQWFAGSVSYSLVFFKTARPSWLVALGIAVAVVLAGSGVYAFARKRMIRRR